MVLVAYDPVFLEHDYPNHPESAARLKSIIHILQKDCSNLNLKWITKKSFQEDISIYALTHHSELINHIQKQIQNQNEWLDPDTYCTQNSLKIASIATQYLLATIDELVSSQHQFAFGAIRPPGHHATFDHSMGFCLVNHIATCARYIQKKNYGKKILIIDWDIHHGNGTQNIFWKDPTVFYYSLHRFPFYPGTGNHNEIGEESGKGYTLNYPISFNTQIRHILDNYQNHLDTILNTFLPDWVLISCGFDAYEKDPIGNLGFIDETYYQLTEAIIQRIQSTPNIKILSILEGGYHIQDIGFLTKAHLEAFHKYETIST